MTADKKTVEELTETVDYLSGKRVEITNIVIDLIGQGFKTGRYITDLRNAAENLSKEIDNALTDASGVAQFPSNV